jgi:hypothetical protein
MFLQQFDNSSNTNNGVGISEHLVMNGSSSVGGREGAQVVLDINTTGNTVSQQYVGVGAKCNLNFTETSTGSVCFGANPVASVGPGVRASGNVGMEVDTSEGANAIVLDRIGEQIVDVSNGTNSGAPGTRDDVAFSMNNAYGPTASLGFKVGVEFGRFGGNFPVSSGGTLIYAQGNQGSSWSAGNGVDWHLGTFSGDSWNDGHIEMTGTGDLLVGSRSSLATTAVHGFLSPPYTSGVPTGSPTLNTACAINVSTSTLNCYFGGAWHSLAFAGGAH